jgi:hypothetical protein
MDTREEEFIINPMDNNKFISNLYELVNKWVVYGTNCFRGRPSKELFRSLHISQASGRSLYDQVKEHLYSGGISNEIVDAFDGLSESFDYDYLPLWVECYLNDKNFNVKMIRVEINDSYFIVPESQKLEMIHDNFLTIVNFLDSKYQDTNNIRLFLFFINQMIEILEAS